MSDVKTIEPKTHQAARLFVARIGDQYPIDQTLIYGSRARGDHSLASDIDIAIILDEPNSRMMEVALDMADTAYDILMETGLFISPLPVWIAQWNDPDSHNNPWLIRAIKRDGIAL